MKALCILSPSAHSTPSVRMRRELHPPPPGIAPEGGTLGEMLQAELGPPRAAQPADTRCYLSSSLHPLELNPHTPPLYTPQHSNSSEFFTPKLFKPRNVGYTSPGRTQQPQGLAVPEGAAAVRARPANSPALGSPPPAGTARGGRLGAGRPCRQEAPGRSGGHSAARRRRLCPAAHPKAGARGGRAEAVR